MPDDLTEKPITHEMFYTVQKSVADRITLLDDKMTKKFDLVIAQTTKTNGSVKDLQLWKENIKGWIKGFGVSIVVILALVAWIFNSVSNQQNQTQQLLNKFLLQQDKNTTAIANEATK